MGDGPQAIGRGIGPGEDGDHPGRASAPPARMRTMRACACGRADEAGMGLAGEVDVVAEPPLAGTRRASSRRRTGLPKPCGASPARESRKDMTDVTIATPESARGGRVQSAAAHDRRASGGSGIRRGRGSACGGMRPGKLDHEQRGLEARPGDPELAEHRGQVGLDRALGHGDFWAISLLLAPAPSSSTICALPRREALEPVVDLAGRARAPPASVSALSSSIRCEVSFRPTQTSRSGRPRPWPSRRRAIARSQYPARPS